jgi:hypothetical protein
MLYERRQTRLGSIQRWITERVDMPSPATRRRQQVSHLTPKDFNSALAEISDQETYLCSATLEDKTVWNTCSAFPSLLRQVLEVPRSVVFAECVEAGCHERTVGHSHLHDDGVLLWDPDHNIISHLFNDAAYGAFDPEKFGKNLGAAWRAFYAALPFDHIDGLVTHNFNALYDYTAANAWRDTHPTTIKIFNNCAAAHFVAADSLLNLIQALESDLNGRFVLVAASQKIWNWCAFEKELI